MEKILEKQKTTQSVEIIQFDFRQLPAYKDAVEKQNQLVKKYPFISITDSASYKEAKASRTALRKGRYDIQNERKLIYEKIKDFKLEVDEESANLIGITKIHENKQQAEIDRYEREKAKEKAEKERIERERIQQIKDNIISFRKDSDIQISESSLTDLPVIIQEIENHTMECEEYKSDYELVKSRLLEKAISKLDLLTREEKLRIEREEIAAEKAKQAKRDEEKRTLGEKRKNLLTTIGVDLSVTDCSNMSDEMWENYYLEKQEAYKRIEDQKKEEKRKQDIIDSIGKDRSEKLAKFSVKMSKEACASLTIEDFNTLYENSKKEADRKAKEIEDKRTFEALGRLRKDRLARLNVDMSIEDCARMSAEMFNQYYSEKQELFNKAKAEKEEAERKAKEEEAAKQKARKEALKPQKEQAIAFLKSISFDIPTIITDKEIREIILAAVDNMNTTIQDTVNYLNA